MLPWWSLILVWLTLSGFTLGTQGESVNCLVLLGDGHAMVSGSSDRLVKVWGFDDGRWA